MNKELFFKQIEELRNNKKLNHEIDSYIFNLVINNSYISFCYNELYQKTPEILPEYNINVYINLGISPSATTIYFKNKEIIIRNKPISEIIDRTYKELQTYSINNISIEDNKNLPDNLLKNSNNNDTYDILILFAKKAVMSSKNEYIFNPYPLVFNPINIKERIFDPDHRNYTRIGYILNNIPKLNELVKNTDNIITFLDKIDKDAYLLIKWLILLNNLFFIRVPYELSLYKLNCDQFVILNRSPEKERELKSLRKKYGYTYAFHGSPIENWYSIIYNGLKNYSNTKLQLHGAAYGEGIYMSPNLLTAYGYTNSIDSKNSLRAIAIVEVINKDINKFNDIWVVKNENYISLRMLLLFVSSKINYSNKNSYSKLNITNKDLTDDINALMVYYDILKIDELISIEEMNN